MKEGTYMENNEVRKKVKLSKIADNQILKVLIATVIATVIAWLIWLLGGIEWFDNIGNLLQYITVIIAILAWYNTYKIIKKRNNQRIRTSNNDLILSISLSLDVEPLLEKTITESEYEDLKMLGSLNPIELLSKNPEQADKVLVDSDYMCLVINDRIKGGLSIRKKADLPEDNLNDIKNYLDDFQRCIERVYKIMNEHTISKLHVFIGAPVEISAFITPYFTNKKDVIIYRYRKSHKDYVQLGMVRTGHDNDFNDKS